MSAWGARRPKTVRGDHQLRRISGARQGVARREGGEGGEEEEDGEFEAIVGMLCAKREAENKRTGRTETDDEIFEAIPKTEFKAVLAKSMPDGKLRETTTKRTPRR